MCSSMSGKEGKMSELYLCDPEKNHSCRGYKGPGWCGIICFCTTEKEKSLTGKPLKAGEYEQEQEKRRAAGLKSCTGATGEGT